MNQLNNLTLPDDLVWTDEFTWQPVGQNQERTLTGGLGIEEKVKVGGRPITLTGVAKRSLIMALYTLSTQTGTLTLQFNNQIYTVRFRHIDTGVEASAFYELADPSDSHYYNLTLRFLEV